MFDLRSLQLPIVGAPMAGGPSTPELAAAVSAAGGLGFLAAGYKKPEQVAAQIERVRDLTDRPFGVNLFIVEPAEPTAQALAAYRSALEPDARRLGVEPGVPSWDDDHWDDKLRLVLDARPDVVSFTFGCPDEATLRRLSSVGICAMVTVTSLDEARTAAARGANALTVQGPAAGGHRATFDPGAEPSDRPLPDTLDAIAAQIELPLVAGGGISSAQGVAEVLAHGGVAAQLGTALLLADEAGTNPVHRAALTDPQFTRTILTRAFTGRVARALDNRFINEHPDAPAAYPQVHRMTAPLRRAAAAAGDAQHTHLWAGTGYQSIKSGPASGIVAAVSPRRP